MEEHLASWCIICDDDVENVLVVDVESPTMPCRIFGRDAFYTALGKDGVGGPVSLERAKSVRDELGQMGVLHRQRSCSCFSEDPAHGRLAFDTVSVSVELPGEEASQTRELCRLASNAKSYVDRVGRSASLRVSFIGKDPLADIRGIASRIQRVEDYVRNLDDVGLRWEIESPVACMTDALCSLLDRGRGVPSITLVNDVRSELFEDCSDHHSREAVGRLAELGFVCPTQLWCRSGSTVEARVRDWMAIGDGAGVRIRPVFQSWALGQRISPVRSRPHASSLAAAVVRVTPKLVSSLRYCEPWASVLTWAAMPRKLRVGWSKAGSLACLTASGKWLGGGFATPQLVGTATILGSRQEPAHVSGQSCRPDCMSCGLRPACDQYASLDYVMCSDSETRDAAAVYECEVRLGILAYFYAGLREAQISSESCWQKDPSATKVELTTGGLQFSSVPR